MTATIHTATTQPRKDLARELRMWHRLRTIPQEHRWAALLALKSLANAPAFKKENK